MYYADVNLVADRFFKASVSSKKEFYLLESGVPRTSCLYVDKNGVRLRERNIYNIGMTVVFKSIKEISSLSLLHVHYFHLYLSIYFSGTRPY
jgi:hypothetical protein